MVPEGGEPPAPVGPGEGVPPPEAGSDAAAPPSAPVAWDGAAAPPAPPRPLVSWAPPPVSAGIAGVGSYANGRPPFTVGRLLSDTFARYAADPVRLYLVAAIPAMLTAAIQYVDNPYRNPAAAVTWAPILALLASVIGLIGTATTFALLEGGPSLAFGRALDRGVHRFGWMLLTAIVIGLLFVVVGFVLAILLIVVPILIWVGVRLGLALSANVVDNLNTADALRVSWRATRGSGTWGRIVGAGFLTGLFAAPTAIGGVMLTTPASFGQLGLLSIPSALLLSAFTPLTASLGFSAYRRLVPPFWPPWVNAPAPVTGPDGTQTIPPPSFEEPEFEGTARALIGLFIILDVLALVLGSWAFGQFAASGFPNPFAPGSTFPPLFSFPPFPTFGP